MTTTIFPEASFVSAPRPRTLPGPLSDGHRTSGTQKEPAVGTLSPETSVRPTPNCRTSPGILLYNPYLCLLSDSLDDLEALRIATDNRVRALTRSEVDKDGEMRGLGLDARSPEVARAMLLAERLQGIEHQAVLDLRRELRRSPFYGWVQRNKGIGEKQAARLLAVIGDPYWNDLYNRPRTVSELWAYCGYAVHGGHADRRRKGVLSNWNDKAKMRAHLMAESCVKVRSGEYRKIYDAGRLAYVDATHSHDCARCGPAGKPEPQLEPPCL